MLGQLPPRAQRRTKAPPGRVLATQPANTCRPRAGTVFPRMEAAPAAPTVLLRPDGEPGPYKGPDGQTWLPNDLPAESAYNGPVTGNEKPIISELCTGNSQWDAPAPAPYLGEEPSTISYRPATSPFERRRAPKGFGASMTMAPVQRSVVSNYPYDEEWRNAIMTTSSWRPATTIRRSPATGLHQLERKAGRMLERSRRNQRTPRKDAFIPNRKELRWPDNATRFNPLFVKHEWVGPNPNEQGPPPYAADIVRMATLRKMRELRSRDSRALQKGVFVQLRGVPHSWLQKGYREWTHLDSNLLDSLQPPSKNKPRDEGSLYSTVDRANLSCMEASLRSPSRSPVR